VFVFFFFFFFFVGGVGGYFYTFTGALNLVNQPLDMDPPPLR